MQKRHATGRSSYVLLVLLGVALGGCASSPSPDTLGLAPSARVAALTVAAPILSASASPPVASASAAPTTDPPRPVVPPEKLPDFDPAIVKALDTDGHQKLEIAASVCPAAVRHNGKKLEVGCRSCPPFFADSGPDGKVVVDPSQASDEYFFPIEAVYNGSFTAAGITEAAAVFTGCESHAGNYGGTMLLGKKGDVWIAKSYRGGFHPDRCKTFTRPDSRMILVCQWETDHQGFAADILDTYDFSMGSDQEVEKGWSHVMSVATNVFGSCLEGGAKDPVYAGTIVDFQLDTATPDRSPRLVVTAKVGGGPRPKLFNQRCADFMKEIEKEKPREIDLKSTVPTTKKSFAFRWSATAFAPDAPTLALMKALPGQDDE